MSEVNEVVRVLDEIKRLSPEHSQRAESVAVVVEQALVSAQTTIAELRQRIAELEAAWNKAQDRNAKLEQTLSIMIESNHKDLRAIAAHRSRK